MYKNLAAMAVAHSTPVRETPARSPEFRLRPAA
jgi:hypothetical protein